jgi:transcription antitermination factor NusG
MPWYALYTKPRNEKKVAESLQKMGIDSYCPMVTQIRVWSDRKKKVSVPLINSYVFVNISESERQKVFEVTGVVRFVFWLQKPAIIRDEEIEILKKSLVHTMESFELQPYRKGDKINITQGPFVGQNAIIQAVSNNSLVVVLENLGFKIILNRKDSKV